MNISRDEWLAALGEADTPIDPDALTMNELADMFGIDRRTMERKIAKLVQAGKATRVAKSVTNIVGHRRTVSAYKLIA